MGQGELELLLRFVVAVEHDPLRRHSPLEGGQQLSSGNGIEPEPFGGHQGGEGQGTVGLGGVERQGRAGIKSLQGLSVGPAGGPEGGLVEHVERGSVGAGQVIEPAAAHHQAALLVQRCGDRRKVAIRAGAIHAGFERCQSSCRGTQPAGEAGWGTVGSRHGHHGSREAGLRGLSTAPSPAGSKRSIIVGISAPGVA